ncbi:hypothetical protein BJ912DRAFT_934498 [Pholiota molesta]|nr:hypothetical protein BJ912DRAFT_934498 [Pholiota molesta]
MAGRRAAARWWRRSPQRQWRQACVATAGCCETVVANPSTAMAAASKLDGLTAAASPQQRPQALIGRGAAALGAENPQWACTVRFAVIQCDGDQAGWRREVRVRAFKGAGHRYMRKEPTASWPANTDAKALVSVNLMHEPD